MKLDKLRSLDRKKYQRAVNHVVREVNKSLKDDWLWDGRFVINQREAYFHPFEDHSGAEFKFVLRMIDTKTGRYEEAVFTNYDCYLFFYRWVNEVITERFHVWSEDPNPHAQALAAGRRPN